MTEQEALRELAAVATRIVVLEAEARALRAEAQHLRERATSEWEFSERVLWQVNASRGNDLAVSMRLDEMMDAIRTESAVVDDILRHVMRDSTMSEEE